MEHANLVLEQWLFWVIGSLTGISAVATVVTQNIVRSATWLLFTLAGASALFFLLGADLVGGTQLLVYVGGTMVLVVFGVMLTAQGPFISMKTSGAEWAITTIVGFILFGVLAVSVLSLRQDTVGPPPGEVAALHAPKERLSRDPAKAQYTAMIGQGLLGVPVGPAHADRGADGQQRVIRTNYLLPFEIVSVHLLVVLIGAAYLARAKRRRREAA